MNPITAIANHRIRPHRSDDGFQSTARPVFNSSPAKVGLAAWFPWPASIAAASC
eukprot:CAMPEP_0202107822 /NCGR_PEP_ID=MMETSP0965-20130614/18167_1 /ASSEMBLY_ACC=CAM_ASM_000507 /TAXON_ID=4773 /ORGANISM="Schizochytrium aggregatum, Strain ATCC28209" /LENGTH=53 /DNA_ID=CAMNT_0048677011 /DNA_START=128 /DNA_END=286 /DNA_ORIENTATION=+